MTRQSPNAFGTILVQRGLLSSESLEQAIRLKERQGGSLAVNLVITGAIDDKSLAEFYGDRYEMPRATEDVLSSLGRDVFALIPVEIIYEFGILPIEIESEDRLAVGIIDPSEPEVLEEASFFSAMALTPRLLTIGQMARHYRRMTGKRWKVDWDTVQARRRIQQARLQAEAASDAVDLSAMGPDVRTEHLRALLSQTEALDASLETLFSDELSGDEEMVIQFISVDGEGLRDEELVELTRVKKKAMASTEQGEDIAHNERPRIARRRRGENRRYLDPVEEGEGAVISPAKSVRPSDPSLPSIIIDTTLLSEEEADAHLDMLVNAPHELSTSASVDIIHPEGLAVGPDASIDIGLEDSLNEGPSVSGEGDGLSISIELEFSDDIPQVPEPEQEADDNDKALFGGPDPGAKVLNLASVLDGSDMSWFSDSIEARLGELDDSVDPFSNSETDAILAALEARNIKDGLKAPEKPEPEPEPEPTPEPLSEPEPEPVVVVEAPASPDAGLADSGRDTPRKATQRLFALPRKNSSGQLKVRGAQEKHPEPEPTLSRDVFKFERDDLTIEIPESLVEPIDAVRKAQERDEVGECVAAALASFHKRVVLLSLRGTSASIWVQCLERGGPSTIQSELVLPLDALPCFARPLEEEAVYFGPVRTEGGDAHPDASRSLEILQGWLGGPVPTSAVVCPLGIKSRTIALAYMDDGPGESTTVDKRKMAFVKKEMEGALLRVIMMHKRRRR